MNMKVGDLVSVGLLPNKTEFISIVMAVRSQKNHRAGMYMVQVVEKGRRCWYPDGYIKVLNESR